MKKSMIIAYSDPDNRWLFLFYHVWGPTWIESHRNSIWLRARTHVTSHYTWGFVTTLHAFEDVSGRPLDTFFLGSHNFMVKIRTRVWRLEAFSQLNYCFLNEINMMIPIGHLCTQTKLCLFQQLHATLQLDLPCLQLLHNCCTNKYDNLGSPTLNVNPTLFVIPCKRFGG